MDQYITIGKEIGCSCVKLGTNFMRFYQRHWKTVYLLDVTRIYCLDLMW